ncbi:Aldehyde/histidinol dehydrogenase [Lactarius quietus]|nr:Aldehyde/histidinol dehydrogenase [Lactarius quietus]
MTVIVRRLYSTTAKIPVGKTVESREEFAVTNPATGLHLCTVDTASPKDVLHAVEDAHAAFESGAWSRAPAIHRSKILTCLARALEECVPAFAELETLQTGRAIREMRAQLGQRVDHAVHPLFSEYYAALLKTHQSFVAPTQGKLLRYVQRVPLGVVAQITGVLSVLPGPGATTGKELVSHPLVRKVDVTAGTATGPALGSIAGGNLAAFTAELGGKYPRQAAVSPLREGSDALSIFEDEALYHCKDFLWLQCFLADFVGRGLGNETWARTSCRTHAVSERWWSRFARFGVACSTLLTDHLRRQSNQSICEGHQEECTRTNLLGPVRALLGASRGRERSTPARSWDTVWNRFAREMTELVDLDVEYNFDLRYLQFLPEYGFSLLSTYDIPGTGQDIPASMHLVQL